MDIEANKEEIDSNSKHENENSLEISTVLPIVKNAIEELLQLSFDHIKEKELLKFAPDFVHNDFINIMDMFLHKSSPNYGTFKPSRLEEEDVTKIIKIQKDNLSPKELPSENPEKNHTVSDLPENLSFSMKGGSRRLNMTNRSFMKRKSSIISELATGSTTERTNLEKKVSIINNDKQTLLVEKTSRSITSKKDVLKNFTSLVKEETEDPEIIHMREIAIFNSKEKEREKQEHNDRVRHDEQKVQNFNSEIGVKGHFTFGFDGEPLVSEELVDEKINIYAMKVGIKTFSRKFRSMYKHLEDGQHKQEQSIIKNATLKNRQSVNETIDLEKSISDIPMFGGGEKQAKTFRESADPAQMRIEEYRRLYGRKFSRYDNSSFTIDVSKMMDHKSKNTLEDELIMSKRHLTDSVSVNKSRSSSVNKDYATKKLALPRLQGKYKVLDRYEGL